MTNHPTIRDIAHSARKQLDPTAFATVAADFFHTDEFWDMPADKTANLLIDVLTLCTDGILNNPPDHDKRTDQDLNEILDDAVETVRKSREARQEPFHYNSTLTNIRTAAIKYMTILLSRNE